MKEPKCHGTVRFSMWRIWMAPVLLDALLFGAARAGTLSGTVTDTAGTLLPEVRIELTCLAGGVFADTVHTGAAGEYSFAGFPMGSYKISLSKPGFETKDSLFAMADVAAAIDFELVKIFVPPGTVHTGQEKAGAWLPEGNPHNVVGNLLVADSLYIAPGCSVLLHDSALLSVDGNMCVGREDGAYVNLSVNGYSARAAIECSGDLWLLRTRSLNGELSMKCKQLRAADGTLYAKTTFECGEGILSKCYLSHFRLISDGAVRIDSVECPSSSGFHNIEIQAGTRLTIMNSKFSGGLCYTTVCVPPKMVVSAGEVILWNTTVGLVHSLVVQASSLLRMAYCHTGRIIVENPGIIETNIVHCYLDEVEPYGMDTLKDNVISWLRMCAAAPDTILEPPLRSNVVGGITSACAANVKYPALLENVRTNVNGDSCDLWFNIRCNHHVDAQGYRTMPTDSVERLASGAASDGTDIGEGQGPPGPMPELAAARHPSAHGAQTREEAHLCLTIEGGRVTFVVEGPRKDCVVAVYGLRGRELFRSRAFAGQPLVWNSGRHARGVCMARIVAPGGTYSRKVLIGQ